MRGWPRRPHCRPRISGRKERPSIRATVAGEGRAGGTPALRLLREAVEQAVAAGGDEVGLAAAAGLVRGVPGALELVVGAAAAAPSTTVEHPRFRPYPRPHVPDRL